jgi:hypothetical protein
MVEGNRLSATRIGGLIWANSLFTLGMSAFLTSLCPGDAELFPSSELFWLIFSGFLGRSTSGSTVVAPRSLVSAWLRPASGGIAFPIKGTAVSNPVPSPASPLRT